MTWFWLALAAAFFAATADYLVKRHFSDLPLTEVVLLRCASLAPVSLALWLLVPFGPVEPGFYVAVGAALPAEIAAAFLYIRAIQVSPLALTQPFLACTPMFALLTGFLILGESPSAAAFWGIGLLAAGAYGLNAHQLRGDWAQPLRAVAKERGSWMMLVVSGLYAYTGVLGRRAVLLSSPLYMAAVYPLLVMASLLIIAAATRRVSWGWLRRPGPALAVGLCICAMAVCHYLAISLVQAAYMLAVKRLSLLFALLYGGWLLGEEQLAQHLAAGSLMLVGSVLILFWG